MKIEKCLKLINILSTNVPNTTVHHIGWFCNDFAFAFNLFFNCFTFPFVLFR